MGCWLTCNSPAWGRSRSAISRMTGVKTLTRKIKVNQLRAPVRPNCYPMVIIDRVVTAHNTSQMLSGIRLRLAVTRIALRSIISFRLWMKSPVANEYDRFPASAAIAYSLSCSPADFCMPSGLMIKDAPPERITAYSRRSWRASSWNCSGRKSTRR